MKVAQRIASREEYVHQPGSRLRHVYAASAIDSECCGITKRRIVEREKRPAVRFELVERAASSLGNVNAPEPVHRGADRIVQHARSIASSSPYSREFKRGHLRRGRSHF